MREPRNLIENSMRTQMAYGLMASGGNGQPFTSGNDPNFTKSGNIMPGITTSQYYNAVYLKWRLPRALTVGAQNNADGTTDYLPVPNRWLIVRYSGPLNARQATAWIVESDDAYAPETLNPQNYSQNATMFAQPNSQTNPVPMGVYIGRNFRLAKWSESGHSLELTAMGPGSPSFAFYSRNATTYFPSAIRSIGRRTRR